ncbi:MAG: hypothetical protein [Wendovervirus sonii]|uniref:Uncharacterized protein n=1 Tax=phage Lak_Megaphage_Sonny TaxID=3109229 RepID=A0ABZ0Z6C2_9CAUD|nr:MAG: hypothetical protein [phage Lak_Megaphage_Sonny]
MNRLYKKIYEAVNTGIQKSLVLNDEDDVSIIYQHKKIANDSNIISYFVNELRNNYNAESYYRLITYHKETGYMYEPENINELLKIFSIIRRDCNIKQFEIDLSWVNTKNALSFILEDDSEILLHEYDNQNVKFIKFINVHAYHDLGVCDHPIIIHKNLEFEKWVPWNRTKPNKKNFWLSDNKSFDEALIDFDGYEHTYENTNIEYGEETYSNYPAIYQCINNFDFPGYKAYLPAMAELRFIGECYQEVFLQYLLKMIHSSQEEYFEMHKDIWWSSSEYSYDKVTLCRDEDPTFSCINL